MSDLAQRLGRELTARGLWREGMSAYAFGGPNRRPRFGRAAAGCVGGRMTNETTASLQRLLEAVEEMYGNRGEVDASQIDVGEHEDKFPGPVVVDLGLLVVAHSELHALRRLLRNGG